MTYMDKRGHCTCGVIIYPGITTRYDEYTNIESCGVCGNVFREVPDNIGTQRWEEPWNDRLNFF